MKTTINIIKTIIYAITVIAADQLLGNTGSTGGTNNLAAGYNVQLWSAKKDIMIKDL